MRKRDSIPLASPRPVFRGRSSGVFPGIQRVRTKRRVQARARLSLWHNFIAMTGGKPLTRIYFPGEIPAHGACALPAAPSHHVSRVLRLGAGDRVTLFDGGGAEYAAVIARVTRSEVLLHVGERRSVSRESPLQVFLAQGISSAERMDYTVQKAVELGVAGIQPIAADRSVVRLDGARAGKRLAHWRAVAIAACEQCGRNRVPDIAPVTRLRSWLGQDACGAPTQVRLSLAPDAGMPLRELARPAGSVTLLVGPEGGLTPAEQHAAQRAGFVPVRLGPRVLRTETAAVAALAGMQALWGDF
jgi:16S rRNA (uracil1498-N3)-methyltransferase